MNRLASSIRIPLEYGLLLLCAAPVVLLWGQAPTESQKIREDIRRQLEVGAPSTLQAEPLQFYRARNFAPAWTVPADAEALLNRLSLAGEEGLDASNYGVRELRTALADREQHQTGEAAVDVRLTFAYMKYSRDVRGGRVSPETLDRLWTPTHRQDDLAVELSEALRAGDIDGALRRAAPAQGAYRRLKQTLADLRRLADDQSAAFADKKDDDDRSAKPLPSVWERLIALGDIPPGKPETPDTLRAGLTRFQHRHGLAESGEADPATERALNVPIEDRIRTIELNLERWRWLPDDLGTRYILVNIAAFEALVVENGHPVLRIPAIVGRSYRRTPVFSSLMTYMVFSPYWNVPNSIAVLDKLPLIQRDPKYLADGGYRVFRKEGSDSEELDPATIDWSALSADDFPYRLRQDPGPMNALGGVKFMFPNQYNVYLHDTPQRELFGESVRTFSSGCIRLQRPFELAQYLVQGFSAWTDDKIREAMSAEQETTIVLPEPLPVHMVYLTAWVGEEGELNFRDDVYGRDALLSNALRGDADVAVPLDR